MYSKEQVKEATLSYFNNNELATDVWMSKYCLKNNGNYMELTPDDMHKRLAAQFARIEKTYPNALDEDTIYKLFKNFEYVIPQGSPMSAIGNPFSLESTANCFVLPSPYDSYSGIMQTDQQLAQLMKRRGGVGFDISTLRPKGTPTKNAAQTSDGIGVFMERYSNTTREVAQNGRRGALMLTISVEHPEVETFITIKQDPKKVTGANVSVLLTDEFMKAVVNDQEFTQRFPVGSANPTITRTVNAKELWAKIIKCAHIRAEPGIAFIDTIRTNTPSDAYPLYETVSCNPCCFAEDQDVNVITKTGVKDIKSINSNDLIWVDTTKTWEKTSGYFKVGMQPTVKLTFSNQEEFTVTPNHKWVTAKSKRVGSKITYVPGDLKETKDLQVEDMVLLNSHIPEGIEWSETGSLEEGHILGWLTGDGCLSYRSEEFHVPKMILAFWESEFDTAKYMHDVVCDLGLDLTLQQNSHNKNKLIVSEQLTQYFMSKYEINPWQFKSELKSIPFLDTASKDFVRGFISAYFTADGTVNCNHETSSYGIQLTSINRKRLNQIRSLLLLFGIKSSIGLAKEPGFSTFKNGKTYPTKASYRLTVSSLQSLKQFRDNFGFICRPKQEKLDDALTAYNAEKHTRASMYVSVKSIIESEEKVVGCIEVENAHQFTANGIISGNSEIFMCAFDSCRLIALNLFSYVVNPFTPQAYFDFDLFEDHVKKAMRLMDDLIDIEIEHIDRILAKIESDPEPEDMKSVEKNLWLNIRKTCTEIRRCGLGITALGDTLAALGIRYGSEESIVTTEQIYKSLALASYRSTITLAKERGCFPAFDIELESKHPYLMKIMSELTPEEQHQWVCYGRRNVALTTTAPTGSLSLLCKILGLFSTTSGPEPVFACEHDRRRKSSDDFDFVDALGDKWQTYKVYHSGVQLMKEMGANPSVYYDSEANKIDWVNRVKLQAAAQRWVDHAISSTINLPEDVGEETVAQVYLAAWVEGCKGLTVYRDKCRDGVLITKQSPTILSTDAPRRPEILPAEAFTGFSDGADYTILIGLNNKEPFECFAIEGNIEGENLFIRKHQRKDKARYSLLDSEKKLISDINSCSEPEIGAMTRLVSLSLRHGVPINFIVEQLQKAKNNKILSFPGLLARNLKQYIRDGTKGGVCANCGSNQIRYQEGCLSCPDCGDSKCSI